MNNTKDRRMNKVLGALTLVMFVVGVIGVVLIVAFGTKEETYVPIEYETVKVVRIGEDGIPVVPQAEGFDAPSVLASERAVPFLMNRCNVSGGDFEANTKTWFIHVPTGEEFIFNERGTDFTVAEGCAQRRFELEIPRTVFADLIQHAGDEELVTEWKVVGSATAYDLPNAEPTRWESEIFSIVNDNPVFEADE